MAKDKKRARRKLAKLLLPGLGLTPPDGVQRILQLAEYPAGAEKRNRDTDHGCEKTGRRLTGTRSDVLHGLGLLRSRKEQSWRRISRRATSLLP
jgi:hypothetical protein